MHLLLLLTTVNWASPSIVNFISCYISPFLGDLQLKPRWFISCTGSCSHTASRIYVAAWVFSVSHLLISFGSYMTWQKQHRKSITSNWFIFMEVSLFARVISIKVSRYSGKCEASQVNSTSTLSFSEHILGYLYFHHSQADEEGQG